eukprot:10221854-Karenia_brevis.AAC.1
MMRYRAVYRQPDFIPCICQSDRASPSSFQMKSATDQERIEDAEDVKEAASRAFQIAEGHAHYRASG